MENKWNSFLVFSFPFFFLNSSIVYSCIRDSFLCRDATVSASALKCLYCYQIHPFFYILCPLSAEAFCTAATLYISLDVHARKAYHRSNFSLLFFPKRPPTNYVPTIRHSIRQILRLFSDVAKYGKSWAFRAPPPIHLSPPPQPQHNIASFFFFFFFFFFSSSLVKSPLFAGYAPPNRLSNHNSKTSFFKSRGISGGGGGGPPPPLGAAVP